VPGFVARGKAAFPAFLPFYGYLLAKVEETSYGF